MARAYFTPAFFKFFADLKQHNNKAWFDANKRRYETLVRDPLLAFIADFGPTLRRITPHLLADPRPAGGSMFRIYRDIRFSKDKSPYKTRATVHFGHRDRSRPSPGYYLSLAPGEVYAGIGLWHPDPKTLSMVRDAIVAHPDRWRRVVSSKTFTARFKLEGDALKKPPRGYDPDHPLVEDLKRTDLIAGSGFTEAQACSATFMPAFADVCRAAAPFGEFLTQAVGLPW